MSALHQKILPQSRIMALDVTSTHISLAVSDVTGEKAAPFGVLARTKSPTVDAKLLSKAFENVEKFDNSSLFVSALIISVPPSPQNAKLAISYAQDLVDARLGTSTEEAQPGEICNSLFPNLQACLLFSEAHALLKAVRAHHDYVDAVTKLPVRLESRRRSRFETAMNPKVAAEDLRIDLSVKARISASEVLQAVLDDLGAIDRKQQPGEPPIPPEVANYRPWLPFKD